MLRLIAFALALVAFSTPSQAYYCSKPSAPYCASSFSDFADEYDFNRCKREMESYKDDVNSYLDCLKREADNTIQEYNSSVESFNRRAR